MQAGLGKKLYSIVIPTRERHDVLAHALRTVLRQTRPNFEVVVMDNCSSPETKAVVDALASPHIRYVRAPERLSMDDNWELGLQHARGDYVTVLGDDDGLMPDAVEIAEHLHADWPDRIVTWKPLMWFWPTCIRESERNFCYAHFSSRVEVRPTRDVLRRVLGSKAFYSELPTIYFSFVPRALIEQIRARRGRYFGLINPDIHSGVVNALAVPDYVYSFRPLSACDISKHSTGMSSIYSDLDSTSLDLLKAEHGDKFDQRIDPRLSGAFIPEVIAADGYIRMKEREFPDDPELEFDIPSFLTFLCEIASRYSARHGEVQAAIRDMAMKNGLDPDQYVASPPRQGGDRRAFSYYAPSDRDLVQWQYCTNEKFVRTIDDFMLTVGQMSVPRSSLRVFDARPRPPVVQRRGPLSRAKSLVRTAMGQLHLV